MCSIALQWNEYDRKKHLRKYLPGFVGNVSQLGPAKIEGQMQEQLVRFG